MCAPYYLSKVCLFWARTTIGESSPHSEVAREQLPDNDQSWKEARMTNHDRFVRTINWEIPDRIMTYDIIDNREVFERFGGQGDLIERNARKGA